MGIKKSIVVVSEFTVKGADNKGSKGSTPGNYVSQYMAREDAVERINPVSTKDHASYVVKYMARKNATEKAGPKGKNGFGKLGGIAFGDDDISFSHHKVKEVSKDIQKQFDEGKTVMKTVISFDTPYLKKNGIIDENFEFKKKGDFRGHVDQLKLRKAIMHGMKSFSRQYDDLEWIGTIQLDTEHVHCHLCMVDRGDGTLTKDGQQKGKIKRKRLNDLRRGIDLSLKDSHPVKSMVKGVSSDKRNIRGFIKKYTQRSLLEHGTPRMLLACLPDDKRQWRADTNRKEMKRANHMVRAYVMEVLNQPDSGYTEALQKIDKYAEYRRKHEDLSGREFRKLKKTGRERLVHDCMNGVYSVLKAIPENQKTESTPFVNVISQDYDVMAENAANDPLHEFGFRMYSYASRLQYHKKERDKYHTYVKAFEEAQTQNQTSAPAQALYDFYVFEENYNARLMGKYQHFFSFLPPKKEYEDEFFELMQYKNKLRNLKLMCADKDMKRMTPKNAEDYGRSVYSQYGGSYVVQDPSVLNDRVEKMEQRYSIMESDFKYKLESLGLTMVTTQQDTNAISSDRPYAFDDVKALDLHHMGYDFENEILVSKGNSDAFIRCANERYEMLQGAVDYLNQSGQSEFVAALPVKDVMLMKQMADRFSSSDVLSSRRDNRKVGNERKAKTIGLNAEYDADMELAIKSTVQSLQFGGM